MPRSLQREAMMPATVPPTRDRMPGAYCGPRCPHCRAEPGPDCADAARATKRLRHAERAALRRHVADVLGATPRDPLLDESDCIHGCAGCGQFGSDRCNFTCHPAENTGEPVNPSAELLHAGAAKLRANADGATPGERDIEIRGGAVHVTTFDGRDTAYTGNVDEAPAIPNATHYASWPPEAAVALADWLDAAADRGNPDETASAVALCRVLLAGTPMLDEYNAAHA